MISRYKQSIFYGGILGVLMLILKWLEMRFLIVNHSFEIYATCIAVIFTALGVWLAHKLGKPKIVEKEIYIEKTTPFVLNEVQLRRLGLTTRELEVLQLMALAKSN
ncbi:MAG: DNA-binding response regulator, partial [Bacteroidia bacterium]